MRRNTAPRLLSASAKSGRSASTRAQSASPSSTRPISHNAFARQCSASTQSGSIASARCWLATASSTRPRLCNARPRLHHAGHQAPVGGQRAVEARQRVLVPRQALQRDATIVQDLRIAGPQRQRAIMGSERILIALRAVLHDAEVRPGFRGGGRQRDRPRQQRERDVDAALLRLQHPQQVQGVELVRDGREDRAVQVRGPGEVTGAVRRRCLPKRVGERKPGGRWRHHGNRSCATRTPRAASLTRTIPAARADPNSTHWRPRRRRWPVPTVARMTLLDAFADIARSNHAFSPIACPPSSWRRCRLRDSAPLGTWRAARHPELLRIEIDLRLRVHGQLRWRHARCSHFRIAEPVRFQPARHSAAQHRQHARQPG